MTSTPPKLLGLRAGSCSDMGAAPASSPRVSRTIPRTGAPTRRHMRADRQRIKGGFGGARQRGTVPQGECVAARGPERALRASTAVDAPPTPG